MKRFILEEPRGLVTELERLGDSARAIDEGRVFVSRKRIASPNDEAVVKGALVMLWPREDGVEVNVLHDADDWIAVDKPAGIPTIPDHAGAAHSLLELTRSLLDRRARGTFASGKREDAVKKVTLHPTSRLDRDVSGVVIFAKTEQGRNFLYDARERGTYDRRYVAIGGGHVPANAGTWSDAIGRSARPRERSIGGKDARPAVTKYAVVATRPLRDASRGGRGESRGATRARAKGPLVADMAAERSAMLFAFAPITGRTHQLRLHASFHGAPLFGDGVYGGARSLTDERGRVRALERVALHAARVRVEAPHGPIVVESPLPRSLVEMWEALGGEIEDFIAAIETEIDPRAFP